MKRYHLFVLVLSLLVMPALAFAAAPKNLKDVIAMLTDLLSVIIPFIFSLAIVAFLWGVARYFFFAQGEEMENARNVMVYGIVGLFVMLSIWGLVRILVNTFGFNTEIPQIRTGSVDSGGSGSIFNSGGSGSINNNGGSGSINNDGGSGSLFNNGGSGSINNDGGSGSFNNDTSGGSGTIQNDGGAMFNDGGSSGTQGSLDTIGGGSDTIQQ